jgi:hypothetical protein
VLYKHGGLVVVFCGSWAVSYLLSKRTRGVSHCGLAIKYLKTKRKNYGNPNISPSKNIIFQKSSKRNQNPSRYYNSLTDDLKL